MVTWIITYRRQNGSKGIIRVKPKQNIPSELLGGRLRAWCILWLDDVWLHEIEWY